MTEYGIYDLADGGREFTDSEQDLVDRGIMPLSQRIRILNEPVDIKRELDSKEDSSGYKSSIFTPLSRPPSPPTPPGPGPGSVSDYKALSDKVSEMTAEIRNERMFNERLQAERLRDEQRRNEQLYAERLMRQSREYDSTLYNRLYNWGISLMPDYYTYLQRRQLENSLRNLIKTELLLNTPSYTLENLIRKVVAEGDSMQLINKTGDQIQDAAVIPKKKAIRRKSKKSVKKRSKPKAKSKTKFSKKVSKK